MKQKLGILIIGLFLNTNLFCQKTTFYKDENFLKETSEKRAKFKMTEYYNGDTLLIQSRRISDNLLLAESKSIENKAVGIWVEYDLKGKIISSRNFGKLVYSVDPIDDIFDNLTDIDGCENCITASYPEGDSGMFHFISSIIRYPLESKYFGSSGTVYLRFIIDKEGNAKPHSIMRGVDSFIDLEAWQLIEQMPKWNPAQKNGQAIESVRILPVRFSLR